MSNEGFRIDLDEAEKAASRSLPSAVQRLLPPMTTLRAHEGFKGSGSFDAADRFESAYQGWSDTQARRLHHLWDVLNGNIEALTEIIKLYRRVDGRI
ncbi:hypothetical protein KIPE111705_35150 [Kibdelosporangium persicum]|uniref:Uncharacterized protein n=1 Tax=Kibdelosporangium persicum TaxID=2698649 RepID=A0ABX2EYG1_9PSEU|nr:hypothetical protein [Kibdelosporangium persicum]NRN64091.1 hypothetical protein [Kibdelosporangium persicum]